MWGGASRDVSKNGCVADYVISELYWIASDRIFIDKFYTESWSSLVDSVNTSVKI